MKICEESKNTEFCEQLWTKCEPKIRKLCNVKMADHPEEIEEIIADTYLTLCEAVNKGKKFSNPSAWLYGTANNLIKQKFKELKIYKQKHKTISSTGYELMYNIDYLDAIITDDNIEQMKAEIESELSDSEKMLLEFIFVDGLKTKEIAEILNITVSAVKQKRYRLVKKIKQMAKEKINNS